MAKNDVVLLDGIIDQRLAELLPSNERDEVFELLALEETLKDYDLSRDELEAGWIDGRDDGGIDGFYIFINGRPLDDLDDFPWPRTDASLDVWLITCKHHATFRQATLDALLATLQELFDLGRSDSDLKGSYSEDLIGLRNMFASAYRRLSIGRPLLRFHIIYASRGESTEIGESVRARASQVERLIADLFSSCTATFHFIGATELVQSNRRAKTYSLALPFLEHLATGQDSYVLLVKLVDYWKFVSDESGNLRRYLFDSNVRDYLGDKGVNEDIARSLADDKAPDFWWLNNGVTILATNATVPGKTIHLQNIQIVNGLQTTETVHKHFQGGSQISRARALLVKIIVSSNPEARDRIIRATNNQTPVELAALHATDKIQQDIEIILERHGWFYERRRNYYRNIGKPQARFVTPMYLASAVVALVLRNPGSATRLKPKFMRTEAGYSSVFSENLPIELWPGLVDVFKAVDAALSQVDHPHKRGERFLRIWRSLVALLAIARRCGTFDYSPRQLLEASRTGMITKAEVEDAWGAITRVQAAYDDMKARLSEKMKTRPAFVSACCEEAARTFGIAGCDVVGRRTIGQVVPSPEPPLPAEFILQVEALLPPQPWKRGIHEEIAKTLARPPREVSAAIQVLIAQGKRNPQKDGVVYDGTGAVLAVDPDRVLHVSPRVGEGPG